MERSGCLFCMLADEKEKIIWETDNIYVVLDRFPYSSRHLLLIFKEHHQMLHEYPDALLKEMIVLAKTLVERLGMEKYNLVQNNVNQQLVPHAHLHLIECNETGSFRFGEAPKLALSDAEYSEAVGRLKAEVNK